jgi:hypothetical protein
MRPAGTPNRKEAPAPAPRAVEPPAPVPAEPPQSLDEALLELGSAKDRLAEVLQREPPQGDRTIAALDWELRDDAHSLALIGVSRAEERVRAAQARDEAARETFGAIHRELETFRRTGEIQRRAREAKTRSPLMLDLLGTLLLMGRNT